MEKLRMLFGNALAGFLDLCMGACIAAVVLSWSGVHQQLWHLVLGALLGVLPDFDMVPTVLRGREATGNHRVSIMHRPLLLIPGASLMAFFLGGPVWALIAFLSVTWHFVHDTPPFSIGGISWLWPFDYRYWSLWGPVEPHGGGMTHYEWLKKFWLRPSAVSVAEVCAGLIAIIIALFIVLR